MLMPTSPVAPEHRADKARQDAQNRLIRMAE
jgi:hypothetical protein